MNLQKQSKNTQEEVLQIDKNPDSNECVENINNDQNEKLIQNSKQYLSDSDDTTIESGGGKKRTFYERFFSPIRPGSVRAGIFTMSILSLGSGCLALPKKFANMSILVGIIDIIVAGLSAYLTLNLLSISATKHKVYDYSKLIKNIVGKNWGNLLDISMLIYIFGILVLYNVIIFKTIGSVVYDIGGYSKEFPVLNDFIENSFWNSDKYRLSMMFGTGVFVVIPLCLLKDISKMSFSSVFGVGTLFFIVLIIIIEFPWYYGYYMSHDYKESDKDTWINWTDIGKGFTEKLWFFRGMSTLFYAYSCHIGAFPIYKSLKEKSARRIQKIYRRSIIIDGIFYAVVGVTGYLSMPLNTPDLIIQRKKIFDNDIFMTIGRCAFVLVLLTKVPANYNSFRISFSEYFLGKSEISDLQNYLITIPTLLIAITIGSLYSSIQDYIDLLGGFCGVIISFIFPGVIYILDNDYPRYHWKNVGVFCLVCVLTAIGFISSGITIYDMFIKK